LEICGVTGTARELFSQFLSNRYRHVNLKVNQSSLAFTSNWSKIKHGVPQGLVFGPLLFLLYINYFPFAINRLSMPILFVYDTSLVVTDGNSVSIAAKLSLNLQCTNGLNETCYPLIFQKPIVCNSKQKILYQQIPYWLVIIMLYLKSLILNF
jgi:hypothetical protein